MYLTVLIYTYNICTLSDPNLFATSKQHQSGCPTARPVKPVSPVPSDIEIAQSVTRKGIEQIERHRMLLTS